MRAKGRFNDKSKITYTLRHAQQVGTPTEQGPMKNRVQQSATEDLTSLIPMDDRFSLIEAFVAVAQEASFSIAAERLSQASSTISRRISRLERSLGVLLLHRTTRRVALTEAGQLHFAACKEILTNLSDAELAVMSFNDSPRGVLKMSAPEAFGNLHLIDAVTAFMKKNPYVVVELNLSDRYVDLIAEQFDLAIRIGELTESRMIARRIAENKRLLLASPEYLEKHGTPRHPTELVDHFCLVYRRYSHFGNQWALERDGEQVAVSVKGPFRADSSTAVYSAIVRGAGIGIVARYMCDDEIKSGAVVPLLKDWSIGGPSGIFAVYPNSRHLPAKTRLFIDFMVQHFRKSSWYTS